MEMKHPFDSRTFCELCVLFIQFIFLKGPIETLDNFFRRDEGGLGKFFVPSGNNDRTIASW